MADTPKSIISRIFDDDDEFEKAEDFFNDLFNGNVKIFQQEKNAAQCQKTQPKKRKFAFGRPPHF